MPATRHWPRCMIPMPGSTNSKRITYDTVLYANTQWFLSDQSNICGRPVGLSSDCQEVKSPRSAARAGPSRRDAQNPPD